MKETKKILSLILACFMCLGCFMVFAWGETRDSAVLNKYEDSESHITFTYDFSTGKDIVSKYGISQQNQISISGVDDKGYVTFTALGDDPYFRFGDDHSPKGTTDKLAYAVIMYRTEAEISKGEFFTNRSDGSQWGAEGTHVLWNYKNDGYWHAAIVDAHNVWGNASDVTLYAFRFDPLASGAVNGDTIDISYIKFFEDLDYANYYALSEESRLENERSEEVALGSYVVDFGKGTNNNVFASGDGSLLMTGSGFTRFVAKDSEESCIEINNINKSNEYRYFRIAYRTESGAGRMKISALSGDVSVPSEIELISDGFWHEEIVELKINDIQSIDFLRITCMYSEGGSDNWTDILYASLFSDRKYARDYKYGSDFNTHKYIIGETDVPVLTVTSREPENPFCGGGESYGQKFVSDTPVTGIIVYNHATWGVDTNEGYFKLWKWNADYSTTSSQKPLVERELKNLKDNEDLVVTFDELPAGEYCYEVKMTSPSDKAYTGFTSKGGHHIEGAVSFRNGVVYEHPLVASYITRTSGLIDKGDEYGMNATFKYDFTRKITDTTKEFNISCTSGTSVLDICDKGYITFTVEASKTGYKEIPEITFKNFCNENISLADNILIKYRVLSKVSNCGIVVYGDDGKKYTASFKPETDAEWHFALINASELWESAENVKTLKFSFLPLDSNLSSQSENVEIDISYITFFANELAARSLAQNETIVKNGKEYAKAPIIPLDPDNISPVIVIEGEKLNVENGVRCSNSVYDYGNGYIRLVAKDNNPYFYLIKDKTHIGRYFSIKYRTSVNNVSGRVYAASSGDSPEDGDSGLNMQYIADGKWHTVILDLSEYSGYDCNTDTVNYFRYDFLVENHGNLISGDSIDVEYAAFFNSYDEAWAYVHKLPDEPRIFNVKFMVQGHLVYTLTYKEGDNSISEPTVPKLPGYSGKWEEYSLNNTDLVINAVYISEFNNEAEPLDTYYSTSEQPKESAEQETNTEESESVNSVKQKRGCKSLLAPPLFLLILMPVAVAYFTGKKKYRI